MAPPSGAAEPKSSAISWLFLAAAIAAFAAAGGLFWRQHIISGRKRLAADQEAARRIQSAQEQARKEALDAKAAAEQRLRIETAVAQAAQEQARHEAAARAVAEAKAAEQERLRLEAEIQAKAAQLRARAEMISRAAQQRASADAAQARAAEDERIRVEVQKQVSAAQGIAQAPSRTGMASVSPPIEWVVIPGGSFEMGSSRGEMDEAPRRQVTVKTFRMAKTEVTFGQYDKCVEAGKCARLKCSGQGADYPVECAGWDEAKAFSEFAGGRLPTEAEWEYAARGRGKDQRYPWGDAKASCDLAVMGYRIFLGQPLALVDTLLSATGKRSVIGKYGCGKDGAWPVCSKPAGNTPQGLCDMAGNVCEWTADWYHGTYEGAPPDASAWEEPRGMTRVSRGGSWFSDPGGLRVSSRRCGVIGLRKGVQGFRPASSP